MSMININYSSQYNYKTLKCKMKVKIILEWVSQAAPDSSSSCYLTPPYILKLLSTPMSELIG
jgi:hypothetical protein